MALKPKRATGALAGIRVALIEWDDAVADANWTDWGETRRTHRCVSLGAVVVDNAESVTLAGTWGIGADGIMQTNNCMTIPAGMIIKRRFVRF
ncbi:MAG: hypothetical protein WAN43_16210 [Rhodomicrobium sp.]